MHPRLSGHVVAACRARSMPCSARRPAERRRSHRRSAKLPPPALVNNACPYLIRIARYHGRGAHACLPCGRDNAPEIFTSPAAETRPCLLGRTSGRSESLQWARPPPGPDNPPTRGHQSQMERWRLSRRPSPRYECQSQRVLFLGCTASGRRAAAPTNLHCGSVSRC